MYSDQQINAARLALPQIGWNGILVPATESRGTATDIKYTTGGVEILVRNRYAMKQLPVPEAPPGR